MADLIRRFDSNEKNDSQVPIKKFGPESSLSSSPQISHQVYAPGPMPMIYSNSQICRNCKFEKYLL